jgi:dihydropyrimidinase
LSAYDLVIRNGRVGAAHGSFDADVAIAGETIAAVGRGLPPGAREIEARGLLVLPGGVDAHCHIEQVSAGGLLNADTFETATAAAAKGGTTTVISFAAQHVGLRMDEVLADYAARARRGAMVDYAFHLMVSDPTPECLGEHLPAAIRAGHRSIKAFLTYDRIKLDDEQFLDLLLVAREHGALVCVHAENHGMIRWMSRRLVEAGHVAPRFHGASHPRLAEVEAFERVAAMSALVDAPVMIFHVSTAEGAAAIRRARGAGVKLLAETCPQYLFMSVDDLDRPGMEGARFMCSPPQREAADQAALWRALELGDLQTVTSDHAPYRLDETGKFSGGPNASFKDIANGLPGLEQRLPLLFDAMVSGGGPGLDAFVALTATNPAAIYGLPTKGAIAPGKDADVALWDPGKRHVFSDANVTDGTGYTPYAGREVTGMPVLVLRRGEPIVEGGDLRAAPGSGRWLPREVSPAMRPSGRPSPDMALAARFGATL